MKPDERTRLAGRGIEAGSDRLFFAPRRLYGEYLGDIASHLAASETDRLDLRHADALSLSPADSGVAVTLADGAVLQADAAILVVGHDTVSASPFPFALKGGASATPSLPADAPVLILGTGLSMIDAWLALKARGLGGPVIALSRRGVLLLSHLALALAGFPTCNGSPLRAFTIAPVSSGIRGQACTRCCAR